MGGRTTSRTREGLDQPTPSQTMVKKKEAPVADAARAGTGNTNRSPSLASQTIENQHTNHQPLAARRLTKISDPWERRSSKDREHEHNAPAASARRLKKPEHQPPEPTNQRPTKR